MKKVQDQLKEVKEKIKSYGLNRENMRDLKKWILNDLMNEEAEEQINASRYERNNNRKDYRNGYKQRSLLTTDGKIILDKPQFRGTSFHTAVFDNYSRVEKSVESIILESYLSGVSTRSVNKVIKSLDVQVSPSYVSSLSSRLDKTVNEFLERKIDGEYKFIYIDGTYLKIRDNGRYRNKAIYICVGINSDGYREILGARIYDSETEIEWELFFDDLKDRGLKSNVREKDIEEITIDANKMFKCDNKEEAIIRFNDFKYKWENKYSAPHLHLDTLNDIVRLMKSFILLYLHRQTLSSYFCSISL